MNMDDDSDESISFRNSDDESDDYDGYSPKIESKNKDSITDSEDETFLTTSEIWKARVVNENASYWPRNTQEDDVNYILHGRLEQLPPARSKVVRVFLSSTFTDMSVERNMLMKKTFPKLKAHLRDKYGLEFQVVDMRWGVRHEATDDHSSSQLCMNELHTCQRLSIGPTFVTFLGQRYGSRPIPARIKQEEMDNLVQSLNKDSTINEKDLELLHRWYIKDENAVPPEYVLQSIRKMAAAEPSKDQEPEMDPQALWKTVEPQLSKVLRRGASLCKQNQMMSEEEAHTYFMSVTDQEIQEGLLRDPDPNAHCLCFIRTLENINLKHPKAWRFIDQLDSGEIDTEAQSYLKVLEETKIPGQLSKKNTFKFSVPWSDDNGVNETVHQEYLEDFCRTFEDAMLELISNGMKKSLMASEDQLYVEALEHAHQCANKCERFFGREKVLSKVRAYMHSDSTQPLIIHGESGCGKTSIMAKAALLTPEWLGDDPNLMVVLRFLGTTPFTSAIGATLTSICQQIYRILNMPKEFEKVPNQFSDLREFFLDLLEEIPKNQLLVLFLDSLDQLSSANNAHALRWLPTTLPQRVKLIVSTLPREHDILSTLKGMEFEKKQFVSVGALESGDSNAILKLWLDQQQRKITEEQLEILKVATAKKRRPLYLKLVFDEIFTWKSFDKNTPALPDSIEKSIQQLFDWLEQRHGTTLVSRAFGYLTASKNGLTETEMEDILSMDDDVLNDVFEYHVPPVRRLPSILWARIRADIKEYIVDREADGAKVMAWYHRQFIENAERYFEGRRHFSFSSYRGKKTYGKESQNVIVQNISDYFTGRYSKGKKKAFKYTDKQVKKLNLASPHSEADRYLPDQPTLFLGGDGKTSDIEHIRYNKRKISELPHIFSAKMMNDSGDKQLETLLFNVEFLMSWMATENWADIGDYIEDELDDETGEVNIIRQCLLLSYTALYTNPFMLAPSLTGRLLLYLDALPQTTSFIQQGDGAARRLCALVPPHMNLETPGGELIYVINNHHDSISDCCWGMESDLFISVSSKIVIVNMQMGQVVADVRPRNMPDDDCFRKVAFASTGNDKGLILASLQANPWVYAFGSEEGQLQYELQLNRYPEFAGYQIDGILMSEDDDKFVLWSKCHHTLVTVNIKDGSIIDKYNGPAPVEFAAKIDSIVVVLWQGMSDIYLMREEMTEKEGFIQLPLQLSGESSVLCHHMEGHHLILFTDKNELFLIDVKDQLERFSANKEPKADLRPITVKIPDSTTFQPHFLKIRDIPEIYSTAQKMILACTQKQTIIFYCEWTSETGPDLQTMLRIKKHYDQLAVNGSGSLLYASTGGIIDVFGLQYEQEPNRRVKAKFFVTLEAHTKPINNILPVDEGSLFMTSAEDGSLKFWNLERARNSNLVPSFDRARLPIQEVQTFMYHDQFNAFAVVSAGAPTDESDILISELEVWNILKGIQIAVFKVQTGDPIKGQCIVTKWKEDPLYYMACVTSSGSLLVWDITELLMRASQGEVIKPPTPKVFDKVLPQVFVSSLKMMEAFGDGSKAELVSARGDSYILDVFQANTEKYLRRTRRADDQCLESHTRILMAENGKVVLVQRINEEDMLAVFDSMTGMEVSEASLTEACTNGHSVQAVKCVSAHNLICLVIKTPGEETVILLSLATGEVIFKEALPEVQSQSTVQLAVQENLVLIQRGKCLNILDVECLKFIYQREADRSISHICLTSDSKYLLYLVSNKDLYLIRIKEGAVLAWYTMYTHVHTLNVTQDNSFVVMATADRRIFVLLIADPNESSHTERVKKVRQANPGKAKDELQDLMDEVGKDISSDELSIDFDEAASVIDMEETEMRRALSRSRTKSMLNPEALRAIQQMTDSSDEDDEMHNKRKIRSRVSWKGKSSRPGTRGGDGVIVLSSELCSLQ